MNHSHRSLFLILAIALFSTISVYAQTQQDKTQPDKEEVAALREKAFKILDSVAGQLTTLQSAENRARIGANLVESLWKHDEERARSLLRVVQEDIRTELQKRDGETRYDVRFNVFLKLRIDTVERIAKYDGQAAYDFLKVTEPVLANQEPYDFRHNEQALELKLAKQIAVNNPDIALKLGRQALRQGLNPDVLKVLSTLGRKHKEQANVLYKEIVEKLPDADIAEAWNNREFVLSLIRYYEPPDVDESTYRQLVGHVVTMALERGCGKKPSQEAENESDGFCQWAAVTLSRAERYDSRIARIKPWFTGELESWRLGHVFEQAQELLQERAYDQLEALLTKYPLLQDGIRHQVILHALSSGDSDRARKLIDALPGDDPERRQALLEQVESYEKRNTINDETLAKIQAELEQILDDKARAIHLLSLASRLNTIDQKVSVKFLTQARDVIANLKPGKDQTEMRLALAMLYCQQKNDRGFTIMESLLPKLNELIEVAVRLDGFDTNYLRDGEWNMSANGSVGEILTILSARAGHFAWLDLDRAVNLASQFERPEIRLMAYLKLAQSILAGPPPPFGEFRRYGYFSFH